jgi:2-oxoglutarate ferredoxin oxidoreductase subunit alpha
MSIPGEPGTQYSATGLEHNEKGVPAYTPEIHTQQSEKRYRKWKTAGRELKHVEVIGDEKAEIGILSWGSTTGAAVEACMLAENEGIRVKLFKTLLLWPLPEDEIKAFARSVRTVIIPELNVQGQLAGMCRFIDDTKVIRADFATGEPLTPCVILEEIRKAADVLRQK